MNCNTQNAKIASITEKTLIVGIDVGSETHYARAFDWRNYEYTKKPLEFSNTEAGFQTFKAWMEDMAEKHGKTAVIPGMEPTGHYWFALGKFLQDNGMKPVHVNPHHVKKSKELDDNNPNKNDRKDPKTIAALVNEGRFSYPYIPTGIYAEIRSLSNLRFQTQEELTRIRNRLARWFAIYFPEYKASLRGFEGGEREDGAEGGAAAEGHQKTGCGRREPDMEGRKAERCWNEEGKDSGNSRRV